MEHRIIYQKRPVVTLEEILKSFQSTRAEERAAVLRYELDYELCVLHDALKSGDEAAADVSRERLAVMRSEMLQLEL